MAVGKKKEIIKHYEKDARVYDINRRFFLFGRGKIIRLLCKKLKAPKKILIVGCGTGYGIQSLLNAFPDVVVTALDVSSHMLAVAKQNLKEYPGRVVWVESRFEEFDQGSFDAVIFSYSLSMMSDVDQVFEQVEKKLSPSGIVAIVDFHSSSYKLFKTWISHSVSIRTDFPILALRRKFAESLFEKKRAYLGFWNYCLYLGRKP